MLKLKGFIHDLGGEIVESLPGLIRVRLAEPGAVKKPAPFDWVDRQRRTAVRPPPTATDIELHMKRADPGRPGQLTVTLVLRRRRRRHAGMEVALHADQPRLAGLFNRDLKGPRLAATRRGALVQALPSGSRLNVYPCVCRLL